MGNCFGMPKIGNDSYVPMNDLSESLLENSQYGNSLAFRLQVAERKIIALTSQLEKLHQNMRLEATRNAEKYTEVQKTLEKICADHVILLENDKVLLNLVRVHSNLIEQTRRSYQELNNGQSNESDKEENDYKHQALNESML